MLRIPCSESRLFVPTMPFLARELIVRQPLGAGHLKQPDRQKISLPSSWAAGLESISDETEENKCQT